MQEIKNNKLRVLDFSAGIESASINYNFNVIHDWIKRERLRIGGWGIVEGFDMSYDWNFGIDITQGILIDTKGEEIIVPGTKLYCGPPEYETITEDVVVSEEGEITLKFRPYSPKDLGIIVYNPPVDTNKPRKEELSLVDIATLTKMVPLSVIENKITVNSAWKGATAKVTYYYCNDRIDAILIDENGKYYREIGINSESPSATDVDLTDKYLIGFAHWIVDRTIWCEFLTDERTYRKVYVDGFNRLFLNGKLYKEPKWIYFDEPQNPEENDVWYDYASNTLNVWIKKNGVWGWVVMNDFTNVPLRLIKVWEENENPADLQTFLFDEAETNYRFIPDTNALQIIIDQQVVMSDQFTEVVQPGAKPYLSSGIGFKLINPLDRATVVQCIVHHVVKNAPLRNVFQRAAIFINENYIAYTASNTDQIFETDLPYVIMADQLEVFINGSRIDRDTDFIEMRDGINIASTADKDRTTKYFKVLKPLTPGDRVTYKISRYVWSYDQLNEMMDEIENKADTALNRLDDLEDQVNNLQANMTGQLAAINSSLSSLNATISTLSSYRKKTEKINLEDINEDIKSALFNNVNTYVFNATEIPMTINNFKSTDFIIISCTNDYECRTLMKDMEYTITQNSDETSADIELIQDLISPDNTIYISVIHFGI